jgi:hypothetical protein
MAFLGTLLILVVLVVVTARVLLGGDGAAAPPAGQGSSSALSTTTSSRTSAPPSTTVSSTSAARSTSGAASGSTSGSTSTAPPKPCDRSKLDVAAATDHTSYQVGDQPKLMLQVTDTATAQCVADLADPQVELRVYNGESRVWGSHDCKIVPGTNKVTLLPHSPVRVTIQWSGLSSRENSAHSEDACGPRQTVGAGTYTLYPYLGGKAGKASQFSIS